MADRLRVWAHELAESIRLLTHRSQGVRNEILPKRVIKKQQMRWNRWTLQSFLDVPLSRLCEPVGERQSHKEQDERGEGYQPHAEPDCFPVQDIILPKNRTGAGSPFPPH